LVRADFVSTILKNCCAEEGLCLKPFLKEMIRASVEPFDVIIIGGGPAGAAAAITMARRGFRTAIIERSAYSMPRVGETLPPALRNLLVTLGVWQRFLADGHVESFAIRSAWGAAEPRESYHIYNPYGSGWYVDRARFDRMLAMAAANEGAHLLIQARIKRLSQDCTSGWDIAVMERNRLRCFQAPFLIDCTGQTAAIPTGLPRSFYVVDRLIGIVCLFDRMTEPYTLLEAEVSGWWYSAPLPQGRLVVAYMTDADLLADTGYSPYNYWLRQLPEAALTSTRAGTQNSLTERKVVSAASLVRRPVYGTNWLAAGDASFAFDPLSGQGVYNAMNGGILAAEALIARFDGNSESFAEYASWVNSKFSSYLHTRRIFYSKEQRWPRSPFWRRRHSFPTR
jgi:flavin-dependent dehydrogenase